MRTVRGHWYQDSICQISLQQTYNTVGGKHQRLQGQSFLRGTLCWRGIFCGSVNLIDFLLFTSTVNLVRLSQVYHTERPPLFTTLWT